MTYKQVQKCLSYLQAIDDVQTENDFEILRQEIKSYLSDLDNSNLLIDNGWATYISGYSEEDLSCDKVKLKAFINGLLDKDPLNSLLLNVANLVNKGKKAIGDSKLCDDFAKEVYASYFGIISFPKHVVDFCTNSRNARFSVTQIIDDSTVQGIINSLENYAIQKINPAVQPSNVGPDITINNNLEVNIEMSFEIAIKNVKESNLDNEKMDEVLEKLEELKAISKESSKESKWKKVIKVIEWVITQSAQVASIVLPLISKTM